MISQRFIQCLNSRRYSWAKHITFPPHPTPSPTCFIAQKNSFSTPFADTRSRNYPSHRYEEQTIFSGNLSTISELLIVGLLVGCKLSVLKCYFVLQRIELLTSVSQSCFGWASSFLLRLLSVAFHHRPGCQCLPLLTLLLPILEPPFFRSSDYHTCDPVYICSSPMWQCKKFIHQLFSQSSVLNVIPERIDGSTLYILFSLWCLAVP